MRRAAFNTTGAGNTASGVAALNSNTSGNGNTATGYAALKVNSTGRFNTANGSGALRFNSSGYRNSAIGYRALIFSNGSWNTACGAGALSYNSVGSANAALGDKALFTNTSGSSNTAVGYRALYGGNGTLNLALGFNAGSNVTGSNNIAIGNSGVAGDGATIRIGSATHGRAFIAGIRGTTTGVADAIPVLVDSAGQLGTVSSSRRFKEDIQDMGARTDELLELRPVVFRCKPEVQSGARPLEYGLIAEEVAEVFPDLVVYDEEGKPFTVKYHLLSSMLLNELKKQDGELKELRRRRPLRSLSARETTWSPSEPKANPGDPAYPSTAVR